MEQFTPAQKKDLKVVTRFIEVYCRARHNGQTPVMLPEEMAGMFRHGVSLCADCRQLLEYSLEKRRKCPLDPKPACKNCHIHCYSKEHRARMREIMAFSGRRMILRGRLDYLWHYFF
jgi:YbgA-like uncharacterized protein